MPAEHSRSDYRYFVPITTRWMDNDVYGHVNNVTYYSYFDTVANHFLIREGGLDIHADGVIALVVESHCSYRAPVAYPDALQAGMRVDKLSRRSVTYGVAIFADTGDEAVAHGSFVHVFVGRRSREAVPIPERIREALSRITVPTDPASVSSVGGRLAPGTPPGAPAFGVVGDLGDDADR